MQCGILMLWFEGNEILSQQSAKVLGLTLDKKLGIDEHIARVVRKGIQACLSLQAITGMRSAQLRQLYQVCVTPVVNYAARTMALLENRWNIHLVSMPTNTVFYGTF
jgi:hypothetical protein